MLKRPRPLILCSSLVALSLVLTGCQSDSTEEESKTISVKDYQASDIPADGTISALTGVKKSFEHGTLPSGALSGADHRLRTYAQDVFTAKCMVEQGLAPSPVRSYDWNDPSLIRGAGEWAHPLTIDEASKFGFQPARNAEGRAIDQLLAEVTSRGSAYKEAFDSCQQSALDAPLFQNSSGLTVPFISDAMGQPELKEAAERWRTCMKDLGAPDLTDGEPKLPASIAERFSRGDDQDLDTPPLSGGN